VGFRQGRSTVGQVTLLTQDIEDNFSAKKAGAVFVDLTAVCDTVWHRGLTCKLLRLLPDRHMVRMILEMVGNRSFTLTIGNGKRSSCGASRTASYRDPSWHPSLQHLQLSPANHRLQKVCIGWRPSNHAWWWKLAGNGSVLRKDMATVSEYLQTWKLKLSTTKTVSAVFHLNNQEANRELKVNHNNETLPFCSSTNTSKQRWTARSRNAYTSSYFAKSWHHASHSRGGLLDLARVREQQRYEQPP